MQQRATVEEARLLVDFRFSNGFEDNEQDEQDKQDEAVPVAGNAVDEAGDLDEVDELEFDENGDLVSTRQAASSDEAEAEEDEGEAAGRPGNSQGHGPPKNASASTEIVRSEAHGVQTLAAQAAMERFVQPGLSAEGRQRVVAIAAAMIETQGEA